MGSRVPACGQDHCLGQMGLSPVCGLWGLGSYTSMVSQCRILHLLIKTSFLLFILNPS